LQQQNFNQLANREPIPGRKENNMNMFCVCYKEPDDLNLIFRAYLETKQAAQIFKFAMEAAGFTTLYIHETRIVQVLNHL
jgi:hypothetical protein